MPAQALAVLRALCDMCCVCPQAIAAVCAVCNEARIEFKDGAYRSVGAPTEASLKVLVEKMGAAAGAKATAALHAARESGRATQAEPVSQVGVGLT